FWHAAGSVVLVHSSAWYLFLSLRLEEASIPSISRLYYSLGPFVAGAMLLGPTLTLWWGRVFTSVAFHERGIVWGALKFSPWSAVSWAWWNTERGELELKIKRRRIRTRVPSDQRATVQEVLERFEVRELKY